MLAPGSRLYGPLVSARELDEQRDLFVAALGMEVRGETVLDRRGAEALLGPGAGETTLLALQTPGVPAGAVVCRHAAPSDETVRDPGAPLDRDAFKVVDFHAPDLAAAAEGAAAAGFAVSTPDGEYDMAGIGLREAHVRGADALTVALLGGAPGALDPYVRVTDRAVSEVLGITAPVTDVDAAERFYADVLGWKVVHEYAVDGASVASLVGAGTRVRMEGRCIGTAADEPYVGLVTYTVEHGRTAGTSLRGRAVAPRRGLVGAVVVTDDLDGVRARAGAAAGEPVAMALAPFGVTRAAVVRPPYEVPHLVVEAGEMPA
ncbi:VOC family protein [Mumia sp. DW29H23]|uniref:VOC family protein n=1 Tax=Mumia sp. DW29H23 TaxID=3421241 RepID=UPI003D698521